MSKRILIIERCTDCPHYIHALASDGLSEGHGCMFDGIEPNLFDGVPDLCPLTTLDDWIAYMRGYIRGRDEIKGGGKDV